MHHSASPSSGPPTQPAWSCSPVGLLLLIAALGLFVGTFLLPRFSPRWLTRLPDQALTQAAYDRRLGELKAEAEAAGQFLDLLDQRVVLTNLGFRAVARKVRPAVVSISNEQEIDPRLTRRARGRPEFYDDGRLYVEVSQGSGILMRPGLVLTNNHVVQGAKRLRVTFASGHDVALLVASGQNVLTDPLTDLAVIRLTGGDAQHDADVTAEIADSDQVEVGDWAVAVGSPLGLQQTVTTGIISAKGRVLERLDLVEMLQTDAAINPGNSGGPLFDIYGRLIGINVAIATETGGSQGLGFAIPSNTVKEIFTQLVEQGEVVRGYAGVNLQPVTEKIAAQLRLPEVHGVVVTFVQPDSPAEESGIVFGDVIIHYDGQPLSRTNAVKDLRSRLLKSKPGTTVTLGVIRRGQPLEVPLKVGRKPRFS